MTYVRTFTATDERGNNHRIEVHESDTETQTRSGTSSAKGLRELRTDTGLAVNYVEKGRYTLVQTGDELTSSDPDAP